MVITDTGLPGALFAFLDMERDETALSYARDTLTCCLLAAAATNALKDWLALAKRVLTVRLGNFTHFFLYLVLNFDTCNVTNFHRNRLTDSHWEVCILLIFLNKK